MEYNGIGTRTTRGGGGGRRRLESNSRIVHLAVSAGSATCSMALASLGKDLLIDVLINLAGWGVSSALRTDKFFDLLGGVTHVVLILRNVLPRALAAARRHTSKAAKPGAGKAIGYTGATSATSHDENAGDYRKSEDYRKRVADRGASGAAATARMHPRQKLGSAAAVLWAVRLSGFLFSRNVAIAGLGKVGDSRFVRVVKMPIAFAQFWAFQSVWCFLNLLPVLISNSKSEEELRDKPLNKWDLLGLGLFTGAENVLFAHSVLKLIIVPRQARDKRRESTQKRGVFRRRLPAGGGGR
jgi:hypothetical protein